MASAIEELLRRLREAIAPRADAAVPQREANAHPYRTPAAPPASPSEPPAAPGTTELAQLIHNRFGPLTYPRRDVETVRLDPPGLLEGWEVLGVRRWFWQYTHCCAIVFESHGERFAYVTPPATEPPSGTLTRLPARTWSGPLPDEDVDFAPILLGGLRRAAATGQARRILHAVALLHVLATHTGLGSGDLDLPRVLIGDEAIALLDDRLGAGSRPDVRRALTRRAPDTVEALLDRRWDLDGTAGGYQADLSLAKLDLGSPGLSYAWEVLWSESDEGTALS